MARGWESKSVEEQQSQSAEAFGKLRPQLTPDEVAKDRIRSGLLLNRKRIMQQMQAAQNPRHRSMLESALSDIDVKIAQLG